MNYASIPHSQCEFQQNLTPSEMAEYNDYLDSINVGIRDPLPEDFWHLQLGMEKLPPVECDEAEIKTILRTIPIDSQTVINEVLVKRTDRHTYNAQRKWSNGQYGNWALQGYSADEVTDYILNPPKPIVINPPKTYIVEVGR
jgi:hypothetical protein